MGKLPMALVSSMGNTEESPSIQVVSSPLVFDVTVGNPLNAEYHEL